MEGLEQLRGSRLVLLTSRDRDGHPVHRPVRLSLDSAGIGSIWLPDRSELSSRLNSCPDIRLARCDLRGRPAGSDQPARAVRDDGGRLGLARYRITPTEEPTPWSLLPPVS